MCDVVSDAPLPVGGREHSGHPPQSRSRSARTTPGTAWPSSQGPYVAHIPEAMNPRAKTHSYINVIQADMEAQAQDASAYA